jgi:hypothetical protein
MTPTCPIFAEDPDAAGAQRIVALRPLRKGDGSAGWLMVVSRSADLLTQTTEMMRSYALRTGAKAALLTLAIAMALTAAMMAVLTRPLSLLTRGVEQIRRSGFSQPATGEAFALGIATTRSVACRTPFGMLSIASSRRANA